MADKFTESDENEKSKLEHTPDKSSEETDSLGTTGESLQDVSDESVESKINQWKNSDSSQNESSEFQTNQSEEPLNKEEEVLPTEEKMPEDITTDAVEELLNSHTGHEEFSQNTSGIQFHSEPNDFHWQEPNVQPTAEEMNHSGYGGEQTYGAGEIPYEIKGWNWGAFTFNIFWGIGNKTYLPLLCLIPLFNIVWVFVCGAKGNEWAWQSGNYRSVEEFKQVQKTWNIAGIAKFIWSIAMLVLAIIVVPLIISFSILFINRVVDEYGYEFNDRYSDTYYDEYYDDEQYEYSDIEISDIGKWTEDIYDHIQLADLEYDLKMDEEVYKNGTKYEELVKLVGDPVSTYNYGDEIEATWDTSVNDEEEYAYDYSYITVNYDKKTGLIIDKFFSEE